MSNLNIDGLPHLTNALLVTSIYSAGNTLTYCASRNLYALALEGRAPKILKKCTKKGVPIFAIGVTMLFPFSRIPTTGKLFCRRLDLVHQPQHSWSGDQLHRDPHHVSNFLPRLQSSAGRQNGLPLSRMASAHGTWVALIAELIIITFFGYSSFTPWNAASFFQLYAMVILALILFLGWKFVSEDQTCCSRGGGSYLGATDCDCV